MFTQLFSPILQRFHPCNIEEVKHHTQKEKRIIDTLEPVMNQHRLVIDEALIQNDLKEPDPEHRLFYQMTRITHERNSLGHDDKLETLAMGVKFHLDNLGCDTQKAYDKHKEELIEKELREFESSFGINRGGNRWAGRRD